MSNYTLNNIKRLSFQIEESDYWDMHINNDDLGSYSFTGIEKDEECLSSYIDVSLSECVQGNELISSSAYTWDCATNNGLLLENIGFTGIDNGLILYKKDRITNQEFYDIYTNSEYSIPSEDLRLHLHMVSGNTYLYDYPVTIEPLKIKLNGGFYQGFFRANDDYYILPATIKKEWNLEFKLKKHEYEPESEKTLNAIHPNNKGIFFYIGTRAENKWVELYNESSIPSGITSTLDRGIQFGENCPSISGNSFDGMDNHYSGETKESGETSISYSYDDHGSWYTHDGISNYPINPNNNVILDDEEFDVEWDEPMNEDGEPCYIEGEEPSNNFVEEELDLHSVKYETKRGVSISSANEDIIETDNKFLMFDRTKNGLTAKNYLGNEVLYLQHKKKGFKGNLFMYMNRTPSGYTALDIDELTYQDLETYDYFYKDIYENALAFIIHDDGSIGYRYLIHDCSGDTIGHYSVIHGESYPNIIKDDEWVKINVKIKASEYSMRLYFYVNDKLKYITSELPKLNLHDLEEMDEKEEGVPFNISIGGGTQGLAERIMPDYMLNPTKIYPIEQYFAGSFIGDFQYFKFYTC